MMFSQPRILKKLHHQLKVNRQLLNPRNSPPKKWRLGRSKLRKEKRKIQHFRRNGANFPETRDSIPQPKTRPKRTGSPSPLDKMRLTAKNQ
jgi:hypothetical protein